MSTEMEKEIYKASVQRNEDIDKTFWSIHPYSHLMIVYNHTYALNFADKWCAFKLIVWRPIYR